MRPAKEKPSSAKHMIGVKAAPITFQRSTKHNPSSNIATEARIRAELWTSYLTRFESMEQEHGAFEFNLVEPSSVTDNHDSHFQVNELKSMIEGELVKNAELLHLASDDEIALTKVRDDLAEITSIHESELARHDQLTKTVGDLTHVNSGLCLELQTQRELYEMAALAQHKYASITFSSISSSHTSVPRKKRAGKRRGRQACAPTASDSASFTSSEVMTDEQSQGSDIPPSAPEEEVHSALSGEQAPNSVEDRESFAQKTKPSVDILDSGESRQALQLPPPVWDEDLCSIQSEHEPLPTEPVYSEELVRANLQAPAVKEGIAPPESAPIYENFNSTELPKEIFRAPTRIEIPLRPRPRPC